MKLLRMIGMSREPRRNLVALVVVLCMVTATQLPAVSQPSRGAYLLGPGDVLDISVWDHPDLTREVTLPPGGELMLPLIGPVTADGMSVEQLRVIVIKAYAEYIINPQVTISIKTFRTIQVSVIGQVSRPGTYALPPGAGLLSAISAAGGFTDTAALDSMELIHQGQPAVNVDLRSLLAEQSSPNVSLQAGDTLMVREETNNRFYVIGDVDHPGAFPLKGDVTLLQAIAMAGGPIQRGAGTATDVHIVRRNGTSSSVVASTVPGQVQTLSNGANVLTAHLQSLMQAGGTNQDVKVQPGDVVVIPQRGIVSLGSFLNWFAYIAVLLK